MDGWKNTNRNLSSHGLQMRWMVKYKLYQYSYLLASQESLLSIRISNCHRTKETRFTVAHDQKHLCCFVFQWIMEGIELEMTKEELQKWIREKVTNNALVVDMMETSSLLQSLLERRENEAVHLLQLCRSVSSGPLLTIWFPVCTRTTPLFHMLSKNVY